MSVLSVSQVTQLANQAGFSGNDLPVAVAIAHAESQFDTAARNDDSNGTTDLGLWQINTVNGYDPALLVSSPSYNATAAFKIYTAWGRNFNAWTTFTSGAYKAYLGSTAGNAASPAQQKVQSGTSNGYPKGQCTWWCDFRYHQLTGYYVPWSANAKDWDGNAQQYGWNVSTTPHVPSIVVLQPGTQGSDPTFGHVAIAEKLNTDGSVLSSAQNVTGVQLVGGVAYLNYKAGPGVSFVWAGSGTQNQTNGNGASNGNNSSNSNGVPSFTPLLQQVHETLVALPGFEGIAYGLDEAETYPGWIDLTNHDKGGFLGWLNPSNSFDIVGWTRSIGASVSSNSIPLAIRGGLVLLGFLILIFLFLRVLFGVGKAAIDTAEKIAPLAAAAA